MIKNKQSESVIDTKDVEAEKGYTEEQYLNELVEFFDLLARLDFESKMRKKGIDTSEKES